MCSKAILIHKCRAEHSLGLKVQFMRHFIECNPKYVTSVPYIEEERAYHYPTSFSPIGNSTIESKHTQLYMGLNEGCVFNYHYLYGLH